MEAEDPDILHLRAAIRAAANARARGNHPFGSILTDTEGQVLFEAENTVVTTRDATGHAEANLVRLASQQLNAEDLARCTLYTSTEPCPMCAGAIYWAGIGRVVYGCSEEQLLALTAHNPAADSLMLSCREVFAHGRRTVAVRGPLLEDESRVVHEGFW